MVIITIRCVVGAALSLFILIIQHWSILYEVSYYNNNNNNFIKMATIAVELYNWHSKTTNDNKLIKTKI